MRGRARRRPDCEFHVPAIHEGATIAITSKSWIGSARAKRRGYSVAPGGAESAGASQTADREFQGYGRFARMFAAVAALIICCNRTISLRRPGSLCSILWQFAQTVIKSLSWVRTLPDLRQRHYMVRFGKVASQGAINLSKIKPADTTDALVPSLYERRCRAGTLSLAVKPYDCSIFFFREIVVSILFKSDENA
jgi:hypothetical protein